jgi:SMC interacting uncharacterized protein involved in chromosome segregation
MTIEETLTSENVFLNSQLRKLKAKCNELEDQVKVLQEANQDLKYQLTQLHDKEKK